jgi:hypothetical protein
LTLLHCLFCHCHAIRRMVAIASMLRLLSSSHGAAAVSATFLRPPCPACAAMPTAATLQSTHAPAPAMLSLQLLLLAPGAFLHHPPSRAEDKGAMCGTFRLRWQAGRHAVQGGVWVAAAHLTRCPELAWCSWMASAMTRGALPGTGSRPQCGSTGPPEGPSSPVSPWISGHSSAKGRRRGRPWPCTTAARATRQGGRGVRCEVVIPWELSHQALPVMIKVQLQSCASCMVCDSAVENLQSCMPQMGPCVPVVCLQGLQPRQPLLLLLGQGPQRCTAWLPYVTSE